MAEIIVREAIAQGLREALEQDESVFLLGEDIGEYDGAYAVTRGFLTDFGPERIRDTPISESGFVGGRHWRCACRNEADRRDNDDQLLAARNGSDSQPCRQAQVHVGRGSLRFRWSSGRSQEGVRS